MARRRPVEIDLGALAGRVPLRCVVAIQALADAGAVELVGRLIVVEVAVANRLGLGGAAEAVREACPGVVMHDARRGVRLRQDIIAGAAWALYADAWLLRAEERGVRFPPGAHLDRYIPRRVPAAARRKAIGFVRAFEAKNQLDAAFAFELARDAEGRHEGPVGPRDFGYYLAMQGMGHGVGWSDYHPDPGFAVPHVEFYL